MKRIITILIIVCMLPYAIAQDDIQSTIANEYPALEFKLSTAKDPSINEKELRSGDSIILRKVLDELPKGSIISTDDDGSLQIQLPHTMNQIIEIDGGTLADISFENGIHLTSDEKTTLKATINGQSVKVSDLRGTMSIEENTLYLNPVSGRPTLTIQSQNRRYEIRPQFGTAFAAIFDVQRGELTSITKNGVMYDNIVRLGPTFAQGIGTFQLQVHDATVGPILQWKDGTVNIRMQPHSVDPPFEIRNTNGGSSFQFVGKEVRNCQTGNCQLLGREAERAQLHQREQATSVLQYVRAQSVDPSDYSLPRIKTEELDRHFNSLVKSGQYTLYALPEQSASDFGDAVNSARAGYVRGLQAMDNNHVYQLKNVLEHDKQQLRNFIINNAPNGRGFTGALDRRLEGYALVPNNPLAPVLFRLSLHRTDHSSAYFYAPAQSDELQWVNEHTHAILTAFIERNSHKIQKTSTLP